jgi:murein L,D-transpeptidase YcbB/YkuD
MHMNAGKGDGFEAFYGVGSTAKGSKGLAQAIEKEVKAIGQNSRGCKTKTNSDGSDYFGFIRQTNMPAAICEGCFVDNKTDVKQFDTKAELRAYGVAVAKGVIAWAVSTGKAKKATSSTAKKETAKKEPAKKASTCTIELPVLTQGDKGAAVGTMQTLIEADGISCGSTGSDKSFGPATDRAVRKYQKKHGLPVDGSCGPATWNSLLK